MKKIRLSISIIAIMLMALSNAKSQTNTEGNDSALKHAEEKVLLALNESFRQQSMAPLNQLDATYQQLTEKSNSWLPVYWHSYLALYRSIYQLKNDDKKQAAKTIDKAITRLEDSPNKGSEAHALLAYLYSFSIQFKGGMGAMLTSRKVKKAGEKALELNPQNLRAYYVLASNDYYTPEQYGGGKIAESYLQKAIELPEQQINNPYFPSWGKEEAYKMLVQLYLKRNQTEQAHAVYNEGIKKYPESYELNLLGKKVTTH